jgi:YaaC-like Protein
MPSVIWNMIRMTRATPPGRASADDEPTRRATYVAALQQFDELMAAAAEVGPASRPLPLFYALSQAGRAIAAAHAGEDWAFHGHGLKMDEAKGELLQRRVYATKSRGAFHVVADAVNSPPLMGDVEIGAMWCSLPDLSLTPLPDPSWHLAVRVWPQEQRTPVRIRWTTIPLIVPFGWQTASDDLVKEKLDAYDVPGDWTLDAPFRPVRSSSLRRSARACS